MSYLYFFLEISLTHSPFLKWNFVSQTRFAELISFIFWKIFFWNLSRVFFLTNDFFRLAFRCPKFTPGNGNGIVEKYFGPVPNERYCVDVCVINYYNGVTVSLFDQHELTMKYHCYCEKQMTQPNTFSSNFKTCIIYGKNIVHY